MACGASRINVREILLFLAVAFGPCWLLAGAFRLTGLAWGSLPSQMLGVVYMFGPLLAVVVVQKWVRQEPVFEPMGVTFEFNRWWLVAWLAPVAAVMATLGVSLFLPGVRFSPEMAGVFERIQRLVPPERLEQMKAGMRLLPVHPFWFLLGAGLAAGPTSNALVGFGEEVGWRGFLQRELAPLGFWRSSFLIGAMWGIWHAPLVLQGHNYPQHPALGAGMMTVWCMLMSPLFAFVRLKAKSVIPAAIMHGTINAVAGLAFGAVEGGNDLMVGLSGLSGFIVLAVANLLLLAARPGRAEAG